MNRLITVAVVATATAVVLTGCDRLTGDHITPYPAADASGQPADHLTPGLWTATPAGEPDGCLWAVHRNGYPIVRGEAFDAVPVYVWIPATSSTDDYGLSTRGCGEWVRVDD